MINSFGKKSTERLESCDFRLKMVCEKALSYGVMDLTVLEGHRTLDRQKELFDAGKSKIDGISKKGKHNYSPSLAVDIAPYPIDWDNTLQFNIMAGLMFAAAAELGIAMRWGGSWNGKFDKDQNFQDLLHFELTD